MSLMIIKINEKTFAEVLQSCNKNFEQQVSEQQNSFDNQKASFDTLLEDFKIQVESELENIKEMKKQAEKILGIISMKGLAQGYQKIANNEAKKAFIWNLVSICSIVSILFFGYEFLIMQGTDMSWKSLISRIVLTGVGITLFTYCAKQATNHRSEERRNRKIELELASLDPYLKDFGPEKQKEVKQTLVDKYFGVEYPNTTVQQELSPSQQKTLDKIINNEQLMTAIAENVKQFMSK